MATDLFRLGQGLRKKRIAAKMHCHSLSIHGPTRSNIRPSEDVSNGDGLPTAAHRSISGMCASVASPVCGLTQFSLSLIHATCPLPVVKDRPYGTVHRRGLVTSRLWPHGASFADYDGRAVAGNEPSIGELKNRHGFQSSSRGPGERRSGAGHATRSVMVVLLRGRSDEPLSSSIYVLVVNVDGRSWAKNGRNKGALLRIVCIPCS